METLDLIEVNMLKFSDMMREGQSGWIVQVYEQVFKNKTDGFLVEIGVGEVLDWNKMGLLSSTGSGPADILIKNIVIEI